MCGIAGLWGAEAEPAATVRRMAAAIKHRGPDDDGEWCDAAHGVALAFRRLAIVDLTPTGHQPMRSASGRYVIVFNGEVYNFLELRAELERAGAQFRGRSDTEVLLAAVERWGVIEGVQRAAGMFAFALWDSVEARLHLGRDRLGEKPLYYGWVEGPGGRTLVFGSELKALRAHPRFAATVDRDALAIYLRRGYVPSPLSIYAGVRKLEAGTIMTVRGSDPGSVEMTRYWSAAAACERGAADPLTGSDEEITDQLEARLAATVQAEMLADVPLGAFLSGGVDSSAIVALMQAHSKRPVRTFTIGFCEREYDESDHARAVAAHLGTDHTELRVTPAETLAVVPQLPSLYDEPFADSSQIPTFLVAKLARQQVTVSLSGDGGDELFAGYNRHFWSPKVWAVLDRVPFAARGLIARLLRSQPPERWDALVARLAAVLPARLRVNTPGDKIFKLAELLGVESQGALYGALVATWRGAESPVLGGVEQPTLVDDAAGWPALPGWLERMMYLDLVTYLPDDILVKVDRATMGVSLESRAPFLDHRVAELAWRIPSRLKVRDGQGKWILRQVLYRHVPTALIERPKQGFGVPVGPWLRGPLRPWADALLDPARLTREGYFDAAIITRHWHAHRDGRANLTNFLWAVLMFQAWLDEQREQSAGAGVLGRDHLDHPARERVVDAQGLL